MSSAGGLEATATYDAWGNVEGSSSLNSYTSIGFDGVSTDETGLTYFVHRYYDPALGRFTNLDPAIVATLSPFAFVGDNPVSAIDVSGLIPSVGTQQTTAQTESVAKQYEPVVARAIIHYATLTVRADIKSDAPGEQLLKSDWTVLQVANSGGGPPPPDLLANFNYLAKNLSVILVSQFRNLASIATSAYSFADAGATFAETYRTAAAMQEVADAAVGAAERSAANIAAETAWGVAEEAATARAFSLIDLLRAIFTFGERA